MDPHDTNLRGADYPRKRTAIACEICRARRSKCDAQKPSCSKCLDLEVRCIYRKPNLWDREPVTAATNAALNKVDNRLDEIQNSIAALSEEVARISGYTGSSTDCSSPVVVSASNILNVKDNGGTHQRRVGPLSRGSLSAPVRHGHRMPNLISFAAPPSLGPFSYDYAEVFFTNEVKQGDALYVFIEDVISRDIQADFSPQTCWKLQRAFASGFLRWMPLFDDETCLQQVKLSSAAYFSDQSVSSCVTLLILAIGAMTVDENIYHEDPSQLPGIAYLCLAYRILKSRKYPIGDVQHLQCQILFSSVYTTLRDIADFYLRAYLSFAMRPVQSWQEIDHVSKECFIMLKMNRMSEDLSPPRLKERLFWVTYVIENELEVCLELPSSGIRTFQEAISLPTGTAEEEALYFFLALISLRKLLFEVIETIGFKSGHALYVPIVAVELRNQVLSWHEHLPGLLQFPLDASPLFDLRKAHLRGQMFCLLGVIYWPFVLRHVENTANCQVEPSESIAERLAVHERAKECVECCVLHLKASEGIMMQKTLVSHSTLRAFYAIIMVLLLAYRPVHHCSFPDDVVHVIAHSLEILNMWHKVPFMKEPIHRIHSFAAEAGITVSLPNE